MFAYVTEILADFLQENGLNVNFLLFFIVIVAIAVYNVSRLVTIDLPMSIKQTKAFEGKKLEEVNRFLLLTLEDQKKEITPLVIEYENWERNLVNGTRNEAEKQNRTKFINLVPLDLERPLHIKEKIIHYNKTRCRVFDIVYRERNIVN